MLFNPFFQIDTKKLKTDRRQQLEKGIRIQSKERFAEVLEEMKKLLQFARLADR
ncbi:hypothetical protein GCM10020331_035500 [Ectobacillus funiculus]